MRRGRSAPKADEGGDDSSPMVVGTGVTMDYSAVDNPSLNVSASLYLFFLLFFKSQEGCCKRLTLFWHTTSLSNTNYDFVSRATIRKTQDAGRRCQTAGTFCLFCCFLLRKKENALWFSPHLKSASVIMKAQTSQQRCCVVHNNIPRLCCAFGLETPSEL